MPSVSIIVNIHNGATFLREAIDSALAQSFTDWELIAWDDCSSDSSAAVVAGYGDPRIKYFLSPELTSLGKARDNAIRQARGEWLAFLDQDDIWLPYKLAKQMVLADDAVGIIYGRTLLLYAGGKRRDYDYAHEFVRLPEGDIFTELFKDACFIAMSSAMLRRAAVDRIGGIPDDISLVPDYYMYTAIAHRYEARAIQDVVSLYRMHSGNLSRSRDPELSREPLLILNKWAAFLEPEVVAYRRQAYSTVLALDELRHLSSFITGLRRLLRHGSLKWLLQRPFVHTYRLLRRTLKRPYWQQTTPNCV